jgi:probable phosphoglycerate mutase
VIESATRIVAVRHGQTAWNVDKRIQGQIDVGLDATGQWQARRVAQSLCEERFDAIYASDLARACDTARAIAQAVGLDVRTDRGLRERSFGVFQGLTFAEIEQRFPEPARRWRQREAGFGPDGGESLERFCARAVGAVKALAARHRGQHIAVVTHGGVLDALYRAASRVALDAPRSWQLDNASINRLLASDSGLVVVGWADTLHLERSSPARQD